MAPLAAAAGPSPSSGGRPLPARGVQARPRPGLPRPRRRRPLTTAPAAPDENAPSTSGSGGSGAASPPQIPPLPPTDPEARLRSFPWWKALLTGRRTASHPSIYRIMDALDTAPRVRVRTAGDRKIDQLADLAVLNARLAPPGSPDAPDPTEVRKRLEFLRTRRALWARVYEAVTRRDVAATLAVIEAATAEVGYALEDRADGRVGVGELSSRLAGLRTDVAAARARLATSSAALAASAARLAALRADAEALEAALARGQAWADAGEGRAAAAVDAASSAPPPPPSTSASPALWWPVAFSSGIRPGALAAFDLSGDPWVLFRPQATSSSTTSSASPLSCLLDECAHRACPLSLGRITPDGHAQCPYHGWTFGGGGALVDAPSTRARPRGVRVPALPVVEADGVVWAWRPPGGAAALRVVAAAAAATCEEGASSLPPLLPPGPPPTLATTPTGYSVVAEAVVETTDPPAVVLARLASGRVALASGRVPQGTAAAAGATARLLLGAVAQGAAASSTPPVADQLGYGLILTSAGPPRPDDGSRPLRLLHAVSPAGGPSNPAGCRVLLRVCLSEHVPWLARAGPGSRAGWMALAEAGVRADAGPGVSRGVPEVGVARTAGGG